MAKVNNIKRLTKEGFDEEYHQLVDTLSYSLNPLIDQIVNAFNKNINFDNINQELVSIEATVNASGVPKSELNIKSALKTRINGCVVVNIVNLTNSTALLTGSPFINYDLATNGIIIKQITGLISDNKYRVSFVLIG
jgi:hypothetical protein